MLLSLEYLVSKVLLKICTSALLDFFCFSRLLIYNLFLGVMTLSFMTEDASVVLLNSLLTWLGSLILYAILRYEVSLDLVENSFVATIFEMKVLSV